MHHDDELSFWPDVWRSVIPKRRQSADEWMLKTRIVFEEELQPRGGDLEQAVFTRVRLLCFPLKMSTLLFLRPPKQNSLTPLSLVPNEHDKTTKVNLSIPLIARRAAWKLLRF